ncbi:MAG TPA: Gfo/Idh/MocA family oxidoreductase [Verrucomicrobiae bacterium]|nr:Gfo/Idh/MocA family oxidoreductase [Verrucomicrobiae bacterium]
MHTRAIISSPTRRSFLKSALAAGIAPMFAPARFFGQDAPSNLVRFGCIGVGRQGQTDMKQLMTQGADIGVRVVAVCDFDSKRAKDAKSLVEKFNGEKFGAGAPKSCDVYRDFRELLARKDIDGVTIVTPDHWHAIPAIAAVNAGKDVYLEKPLTYSHAEGVKLVEAVRRNKRILQVGSQQRSDQHFRMACEFALNGRLGKIHTIRAVMPSDKGTGDPTPMQVPENLDYESWLGPTPEVPYTEHRVHPQKDYGRPGWLQIEAYCRGMITGWGAHMNDIAQWGNGADGTGPVEIQGTGEFPKRGIFDVHTNFHAEATYANGVRLIMETTGLSEESGKNAGVWFEGDKGRIFVARGKIQAEPADLVRDRIKDGEIRLYESKNHMLNFLECIRSRKDPVAPVEVGHRSNTVCILAHIAMKLGRKLKWDPKAERFVGDDDANGLLDYPHRKPWTI